MYNRNVIFDYCAVDSIVHRLSSIYKVLSVIFMVIFLIIGNSFIDMVLINLFIIIMVIFSNVSVKCYFNSLMVSKFIVFFVLVVSLIISKSIVIGVLDSLKVIDLIIYLAVITMTSSFVSIVDGIESLFKLFSGKLKVNEIALKIGLGSKFINIFYNEWVRIRKIRELRGCSYKDIKLGLRIIMACSSVVSVYKSSLLKIRQIEKGMEVRNYSCFLVRSNYRLNKFGKTDTIMLGINVVVLILIIIY